jgi:hypothetical protein
MYVVTRTYIMRDASLFDLVYLHQRLAVRTFEHPVARPTSAQKVGGMSCTCSRSSGSGHSPSHFSADRR